MAEGPRAASIEPVFGPAGVALERLEADLAAAVAEVGGPGAEAMGDLFAAGGKRLRPALVLLCGGAAGAPADALASAAMALEVCHAATLVHDDVIDRSDLRRGRPTVANRLGSETAIVVGDQYFAKAYELAARTGDATVVAELAGAVIAVCAAEVAQQVDRYRYSVTHERYLERIAGKTGTLIAAACVVGGHLGAMTAPQVEALRAYGLALGIAFQVVDDVLDYTGDPGELGKPVGRDLADGHATLPFILAREAGAITFADGVRLDPGQVAEAVAGVRDSGAIERSEAIAAGHGEAAVAALAPLPESEWKTTLEGLATRLARRRR